MLNRLKGALLTTCISLLVVGVYAQDGRVLTLSDYTYEYIQRLQHRGKMLDLDPTVLPYSYGQVKQSISRINEDRLSENEKAWLELIKERVELNEADDNEIGGEFSASPVISDTERLDAVDPLNQDLYIYPAATVTGYMEKGDFAGQLSFRHDYYYDQDPDGFDAAKRLFIRAEDSYIGYQKSGVKIMLGRYNHHWGKYGEASSIMSTNARSFDNLTFSLSGKYFSFQSILGELNDISGDSVFVERTTFDEDANNRFISMHRLNFHPSPKFRISFFEAILYSGHNTGLSLKYSNPLLTHVFVSDNIPWDETNNLMFGGMIWTQFSNFTLNGQLLIDDFQHTEDKGEPFTFTFLSSLNYALKNTSADLNLEFEAVAYQTYNTDLAEGRYLYMNRGIGTPTNDYIKIKVYPEFFLDRYRRGLMVAPYLTYYSKGEQVINQDYKKENPDGSVIDIILTGQVENTVRAGLHVLYQPSSMFWFELDTGYNHIANYNNVSGITRSRLVTIFKAGVRFGLYGSN
ncbi:MULTISPECIES: capsule assembly Wzi family protein [Gracilimonas]|uniref:Capsule assembly Wzi family protein n=1 Tax=Gracilimonas sediminicola TaxID=2952158 RepID=A0A9X2L0Y9_9BACT|nr:capsule assembly Wzi family protein [Gracilimonas sediminicola]MCP9290169.1 capsule assembly Wzi family protein [Gracilimonas sediminicola]